MPLHGKIVVIKRSGGDGTEFPLTASCLFGRKPDCDIRIQLPQVSKEHCRIDLNENKEVTLTNLSSVNPTRINGEVMKQAERLKHGDIITIIDRSFRFEYPPEPTPKKRRPSASGKSETLQVIHNQQVRERSTEVTGEKRKSLELTSAEKSCLKDGTNTSNLQAHPVKDCEDVGRESITGTVEESKPSEMEKLSPICELYQMMKQNLNAKSPWKPAEAGQPRTPVSRNEAQKTMGTEETDRTESTALNAQSTPLSKKVAKQKRNSSIGGKQHLVSKQTEDVVGGEATPQSSKRNSKRSSLKVSSSEGSELSLRVNSDSALPAEQEDSSKPVATPKETPKKSKHSLQSPAKQAKTPTVPEDKGTPTSQKKLHQGTPQRFSAGEVVRQIVSENGVAVETCQSAEKSKTPKGRRSKESGSAVLPLKMFAVTPGTPTGSYFPDSPVVHNLKQEQSDEAETPKKISAEKSPKAKEAVSPLRVSPRKSPGKKLQAADVLLELEMAAPSSGRKAVNAGNRPPSGKRKSGELERDLPAPQLKRKRVSFGGQLSPELFDKRLPPNSPLRKGATPGRRSLSLLKQSVLRGSSTVDLIEEQGTEMSSPKLKTAQRSPGKTASPKTVSGTPSPAKKSPKTKPKTPSPKNTQKSPTSAKTPPSARSHSPKEEPRTPKGKKSDTPSAKTPSPASSTKKTQAKDQSSVTLSRKSPVASAKKPANDLVPADTEGTLSTPAKSTSNGKRSFSNASTAIQSPAEVLKTPLPAQMASSSFAKTPSPSSSNQTPTVRGRFSVSRISTPSPVADEDKGATEMSECVTPHIPMRRKSMKSTSKKTPKSARKSVLDVMRSRRSGASKANLKVVRSFADIVKFGISKPQVDVPIKKLKTTVTVKKSVVKKPKTPAKKIKEHFSTGHAASPATIVVGKAHKTITQVVGGAPKLVHNVALLRKNMDMNEDLTGIAEIFHTPATVREKRIRTSGKVCPETPQTAAALIEVSVMDTPEETGEMVVSPLSVVGTAKRERFNREAVSRLLQEDQDSSLIGVDAPQESANALTVPLISAENAEEQISVKGTRTPKQKLEPLTGLTGVKRLMKTPKQKAQQVEVEDLRGLKRLLKTPKEPKMSQEASLVGVKEMLKTPKPLKGQPVEDMVGVQRMMKTPKVQKPPVMCITGVKRLLRTPKEKVESGEDLTGVKQLMKTPKQKREPVEDMIGLKQMMQTPKQKVESVEDLTGVKELMKTPKQKGEPVEDMIGLKRMMQTPKQKVESVEDLTGVKELMKTPKQKGQPVENKFGISKLMKSPRQRGGAAIEDFVGLQELMEEPADYAFAKVGIQNDIEISEEKVSISKCEKTLSDACDANMASKDELKLEENQSETPKKPVRGRRQKRVDNGSAADTKESASVGSQGDAEMNNTVDTDQTFSGVKPKRGKQARQITAAVRTPRRKITEIKEKVISPTVVAPVKSTRGKRAKNMEESDKGTTDEKPCEDVGSVVLCDEVKSMQAEIMETAVVHAPAKGRRRMKIEGTPQKPPTPTPVRITGRGRKAKETNGGHVSDDSIKVECIETPPEHKTIDVPEKLSSPEPIMKPRRGRKPKQPHEDHVTAVENAERDVSEPDKPDIENVVPKSDIGKSLQETEEQAPVVKSGRGRKAKAVVEKEPLEVPPKRSRRIAVDLPAQTVASPIPALKSGRGRGRKAQNLDSTEEVIPIKADASSAERPTEPPKKTRGTRKTAKVSDAVSPLESISAPVHTEGGDALPETSVSNDLVKNVQGKTSRRGRIANGKARVSEADEKAEIKTSDVKESGKKASSSKSVNWSSDLAMSHTMEVGEVSSAEGGSQQSKPNKEESASGFSEPAGNKGTETEVTSEPQTKSRRGRPGKKSAVQPTESSLVTEHDDPEPSARKAASSRRGKMQATHPVSDPTKDDAPVAKRGLKRKATSKDVEKETAVDEPVSESVNIESLPKKARGRAAKVEEVKVEASTPSRARRGTAKKAGKALEVEETKPKQEVETPKPAGRGRRKAAQQAEVEPEPTHEMCPTKGKGEKETSKEKGIAVRGKPKTQTKVESTTESRPVRRTRRN